MNLGSSPSKLKIRDLQELTKIDKNVRTNKEAYLKKEKLKTIS